jgi:hypothetical protein
MVIQNLLINGKTEGPYLVSLSARGNFGLEKCDALVVIRRGLTNAAIRRIGNMKVFPREGKLCRLSKKISIHLQKSLTDQSKGEELNKQLEGLLDLGRLFCLGGFLTTFFQNGATMPMRFT